MGAPQDGAARRFVAAPGLHADVAIFHQVETADAVGAAQLVQGGQDFVGLHLLAVDGDDVALGEFQVEVLGLVGGFLRGDGPPPHGFFRFGGWVFQMAAFEGNMQ